MSRERPRCSPPAAGPATPSTPSTDVRRRLLLAARHGCILGLTLVRAAGRSLGAPTTSEPPVAPTVGVGMDESRALQRAAWAGAASVVLLALGVALGYFVGVDDPSMSDAAILERLNDDARQVAAGVGMPVLAAGIALLLWFATGLRRVVDRLSGGDPLAHAIVPAVALFGGLMITGGVTRRGERLRGIVRRVHPRPGHRPRARYGGERSCAHRADRRRGASRRDHADRPAGARPAG